MLQNVLFLTDKQSYLQTVIFFLKVYLFLAVLCLHWCVRASLVANDGALGLVGFSSCGVWAL